MFISIDDLNDWVGVLGGNPQTRTPNTDALAQQSALFVNAQVAAPGCNPSRTAMLTGIYPATAEQLITGQDWRTLPALQFARTLPQHLKDGGYTIKSSGKLFHWNPDLPASDPAGIPRDSTQWDSVFHTDDGLDVNDPGFDPNVNHPRNDIAPVRWVGNGYGNLPFAWGPIVPRDEFGEDDYSPPALKRVRQGMADFRVARWTETQILDHDASDPNPVFLAAGIIRPHVSWRVPVQYFDAFDVSAIDVPVVNWNDWDDLPATARNIAGGSAAGVADNMHPDLRTILDNTPGSNLGWQEAVQAYLASIHFVDDAIGVMHRAVEQRLAAHPEETWIIVLWSDHGFHLGEKLHWHKATLWEESTKSILAIWRSDYAESGSHVAAPVSATDIYPTLAQLAGLGTLTQWQGDSFVDLIENPNARDDSYAVTTLREGMHAVRSTRWRYIRYDDGTEELYDRFNDPEEWTNLLHAAEDADRFDLARRAMATALYRWSIKVHNTAMFSTTTVDDVTVLKFPLETMPTLGQKVVDRFTDKSGYLNDDPNWATLDFGGPGEDVDFAFDGDVVQAPPGSFSLASPDNFALGTNDDFIMSVTTELPGDSAGAGLVFGYIDADNFFELQLLNGDSSWGSATQDVRLVRMVSGAATELLSADLPTIDGGSHYTLVVNYVASEQALELIVIDSLGINYFRETHQLDTPLDSGSLFAISSRESQGISFDDFDVLAFEPIDAIQMFDADGDSISDFADNCLSEPNPSQCDTDGDGYGNICDADLDDNGIVNTFDVVALRSQMGLTGAGIDADFDCDGVVNTFDLTRMRALFGLPPGPSGITP